MLVINGGVCIGVVVLGMLGSVVNIGVLVLV